MYLRLPQKVLLLLLLPAHPPNCPVYGDEVYGSFATEGCELYALSETRDWESFFIHPGRNGGNSGAFQRKCFEGENLKSKSSTIF